MGLQQAAVSANPADKADAAKCAQVVPRTEKLIVRILGIDKQRLQTNLRLVEDLGAKEMLLTDLTMELEDAFLVELPDDLAENSGATMQAYVNALRSALGCPG
jgi:acyl carrier protein